MVPLVLFAVGSAGIVILSWRTLKDSRAHGFYRFFAFELLLASILLNLPVWFQDPFCLRQIASYSLGLLSMVLAVEGFRLLHAVGRPVVSVGPSTNLSFENTTTLVSVGAYRFIRHPLYASLLALVWAVYLKDPFSAQNISLSLGATTFLYATAVTEERENVVRFGPAYIEYMRHTRRFVPYLF